MQSTHKHGDMLVRHYPQVPCKPFEIPVKSLSGARYVINALARYDQFLLANNHRCDYSNASFLVVWDENLDPDSDGNKWTDWESSDYLALGDYAHLLDENLDKLKWAGHGDHKL